MKRILTALGVSMPSKQHYKFRAMLTLRDARLINVVSIPMLLDSACSARSIIYTTSHVQHIDAGIIPSVLVPILAPGLSYK